MPGHPPDGTLRTSTRRRARSLRRAPRTSFRVTHDEGRPAMRTATPSRSLYECPSARDSHAPLEMPRRVDRIISIVPRRGAGALDCARHGTSSARIVSPWSRSPSARRRWNPAGVIEIFHQRRARSSRRDTGTLRRHGDGVQIEHSPIDGPLREMNTAFVEPRELQHG